MVSDFGDSLDGVLKTISSFRVNKKGSQVSLHKYIFLLALAWLFDKDEKRDNRFSFNDELEGSFMSQWAIISNGNCPSSNAMEYPFVHMESEGFWHIVPKRGKEDLFSFYKNDPASRLTRKRILETVDFAHLDSEWFDVLKSKRSREVLRWHVLGFCNALREETPYFPEKIKSGQIKPDELRVSVKHGNENPYVSYLNSLHSRDAGNENALAESQACNEFFPTIHVRHPLVDQILEILERGSSNESIILTGHAGDGKSTIALSVYKKLKGMDENKILTTPLKEREDVDLNDGSSLVIVKDFSEWPILKRYELFRELLHQKKGLFSKKKRLLLISNTGTLLDSICGFGEAENIKNRSFWESELLDKMSTEESSLEIIEGGIPFRMFNLSLWDNLSLAERILKKMLSPENWKHCESQPCRPTCPIAANVALLQEKEGLPIKRLFLMYRKIYEYGIRLTLRQLTAHFAYMLTAGLEYDDISSCQERVFGKDSLEFAFFNRVFGDTGHEADVQASNLRAVREIRAHGFGEKPSPGVERYLWTKTNKGKYDLDVPSLSDDFTRLLERGAEASSENNNSAFTQGDARRQVRRILYFFYDFQEKLEPGSEITEDGERYLQQFLGSAALLEWLSWQMDAEKKLYGEKKDTLRKKLYHVIQEEFTGVRLPEEGGSGGGLSYLYVTLNRGKHAVRQSAQIVLAEVDFSKEFDLVLRRNPERNQERRDLVLLGKGRLEGVRMVLNLPFLDYMFARNSGYLNESLQAVYGDRLGRLKNEIVSRCRSREQKEVLLVRLQTNHTFLRQCYAVNKGKLEVWND